MSALVHCDGPDCDQTMNSDVEVRRLCDVPWIRLEQGNDVKDFCGRACLAAWAGKVDLLKLREIVWWEGYNAAERDAIKTPPATVTPCPYKSGVGRP